MNQDTMSIEVQKLNEMDQDTASFRLFMDAYQKDVDRVKKAVEDGADVNYKSKKGMTPLHVASEGGRVAIVAYLLENGARVDSTKKDGSTPLCGASANGHFEVCRALLSHGADVNHICNNGDTALHLASQTGRVQVVILIVNAGANVNRVNLYGQTPLHKTIASGGSLNQEIVAFLIERGSDVGKEDYKGRTVMQIATEQIKACIAAALTRVQTLQGQCQMTTVDCEMFEESPLLPMRTSKITHSYQAVTDAERHVQQIVSQFQEFLLQRESQHDASSVADTEETVTSLDRKMPQLSRNLASRNSIPNVSNQMKSVTDRKVPTIVVSNQRRRPNFEPYMMERGSLTLEQNVIGIGREVQTFSDECRIFSKTGDMELEEPSALSYDILVLKVQIEEMEATIRFLEADILRSIQIRCDLKSRMKTVQKLRDLKAEDEREWSKWNSKLLEISQQIEDQAKKETDLGKEVVYLEDKMSAIKLERENNFGFFD